MNGGIPWGIPRFWMKIVDYFSGRKQRHAHRLCIVFFESHNPLCGRYLASFRGFLRFAAVTSLFVRLHVRVISKADLARKIINSQEPASWMTDHALDSSSSRKGRFIASTRLFA